MDEEKTIALDKLTVQDESEGPSLGPADINMPGGYQAHCHDGVALTLITAEYLDSGGKFLIVVAVAEFDGVHLGSLHHFTPDSARSFAASLIGAADLIDGGMKAVN